MTFIKTIPEAEARGEIAELYRRLAYRDGTVDPAFKVLSLNPKLLAADTALYQVLMYGDSPLSRAERELLARTVSQLNGCDRCSRHHSERFEELSARAASDHAGGAHDSAQPSDRRLALLGFATQLTREPSAISATDIESLRNVGLNDRAILDACNIVAYFAYANRVTLGLGVSGPEPLGEWSVRSE